MIADWMKEIETGIASIDNHHKKIIRNMNKLVFACSNSKKSEILSLIQDLEKDVNAHFKIEEGWMQKYNYPEFLSHKSMHFVFKTAFINFKQEVDSKKKKKCISELCDVLVDWLIWHINVEDRLMAEYIQDRKV